MELLGITIYNKLTFNEHISSLLRNASYKLCALRRIRKYVTQDQGKLLYNAFINSQFSCALISSMFCRRDQYLTIQKINLKALKVVYNSDEGYDGLFQMNNEITIYQNHLHALICEVFKSLNNSNTVFMCSYFTFKNITYNIYNTRNGPFLKLPDTKSSYCNINSV